MLGYYIVSILAFQSLIPRILSKTHSEGYKINSLTCSFNIPCKAGCFSCKDISSYFECLDSSSILSCLEKFNKCQDSHSNSDSGSKKMNVSSSLCLFEIDLRTKDSSLLFHMHFQSPLSKSTLLAYKHLPSDSFDSLLNEKPEVHALSSDFKKIKGNYFIIVIWSQSSSSNSLELEWKTEKSEKNQMILVLTSVLIPCFVVSCCFLCIFSYFRRRKMISRRSAVYEAVEMRDFCEESFFDSVFPLRYYLVQTEELCPICFELFSIGHQVRITICNHSFHAECFEEWIHSRPVHLNCPICKSPLMTSK